MGIANTMPDAMDPLPGTAWIQPASRAPNPFDTGIEGHTAKKIEADGKPLPAGIIRMMTTVRCR